MTTVYRHPDYFPDPPRFEDFLTPGGKHHYDFAAHYEAEEQWVRDLQAEARRANPKADLAGETIYFPMGDGKAVYVMWSNSSMVHCPIGDSWSIPDAHARGLRVRDIRDMIRSDKALREIFGGGKQQQA